MHHNHESASRVGGSGVHNEAAAAAAEPRPEAASSRGGGLVEAISGGGQPPLTNRGVVTSYIDLTKGVKRVEKKLDFVALSAPKPSWAKLLSVTLEGEPSYQRGFGSAESRLVLGGTGYRAFDPHQSSGVWGTEYEHWRFGGAVLFGDLLGHLRGVRRGRATRTDFAFDLHGQDVDVRVIRRAVKERHPRRCTQVIEGDQGCTLYLGSPTSDLRIRIYNKGVQWFLENGYDPEKVQHSDGPWWRVEVQARGDYAESLWRHYVDDPNDAFKAAAGILQDFVSLDVGVERAELAKVTARASEVEETLFHLVEQYGTLIAAAEAEGVDLMTLARAKLARATNRMVGHRFKRRREAIQAAGGAGVVMRGVLQLIARGDAVGVIEGAA